MAAATVTTRYDSIPKSTQHVRLTASDGETFVSSLGTPEFCQITSAEDMAAETNSWSYSISGRTITLYADGVTDKLIALSVYGKK